VSGKEIDVFPCNTAVAELPALTRHASFSSMAYDALLGGGSFVAIENLIDDDRRQNVFGLLMSLNILIEFGDAFDFTGGDFNG